MPMLACLPCRTFFTLKRNGVTLVEGMPAGRDGEGTDYKLWVADLYGCESCGAEIVAGFGQSIDDCLGMFRAGARPSGKGN